MTEVTEQSQPSKRYVIGAGAAACAACCAAPLLALLGVAVGGLVAVVAALAFAGGAFALVVLAGAGLVLWRQRQRGDGACATSGCGRVQRAD